MSAIGSTPLSLAVWVNEAMTAQLSAPRRSRRRGGTWSWCGRVRDRAPAPACHRRRSWARKGSSLQQLGHRAQPPAGAPDPVRQGRTVEIDTITGEDLGLAIERQASRAEESHPRAPRTLREPLGSYGSQCSALTVQKRSVGKGDPAMNGSLPEPVTSTFRPFGRCRRRLNLRLGHRKEKDVDPTQGRIQRRFLEVSTDHRAEIRSRPAAARGRMAIKPGDLSLTNSPPNQKETCGCG
jgi:hypothetical protein